MALIERSETPASAVDFDRFRLQRFVEALPAEELERRGAPIDLADVAAALEDNPKAVLLAAVGPERQRLVGNVTGSRSRIARAFGVSPAELTGEIRRRLALKPEVFGVAREDAPAQEI